MSAAAGPYHHQAFGLTIRSAIPLPELLPAPCDISPDVDIVYSDVPTELHDALARGVRFQVGKGQLLLMVDRVARYFVENGQRISIQRDPSAEDDDVRVFLLGSVFGALLHQRHDLVLHASAIQWDRSAIAFTGLSGVGKSTLAAAFQKRGHAILTDDLCVVRPGGTGQMLAFPGFPQTKLWRDSLKRLDLPSEGLRSIRNKVDKRAVPLGDAFGRQPLPITKVFVLHPHNGPELGITFLAGPDKFLILKNYTYRFGFLAAIEGKMNHFQNTMRLAKQASVAVVKRPRASFQLDDLVTLIEANVGT